MLASLESVTQVSLQPAGKLHCMWRFSSLACFLLLSLNLFPQPWNGFKKMCFPTVGRGCILIPKPGRQKLESLDSKNMVKSWGGIRGWWMDTRHLS